MTRLLLLTARCLHAGMHARLPAGRDNFLAQETAKALSLICGAK